MSSLISTDSIFASTKVLLKSYDAAGLISDPDLFEATKWLINRFGIGQLVERELVLDVENFKVELPADFNMLWVLHRCDSCGGESGGTSTYRYLIQKETTAIFRDWSNYNCYAKCSACRDKSEYRVTRSIELEDKTCIKQEFDNRTLMRLNKRVSKGKCHANCPNYYVDSKDEFNIDDKNLYFNFCEGHVHLQYYANPIDEEGYPLILNDEYMKQALKDYLTFRILQGIYYNGDAQVERMLDRAEIQHQKSLKEALFNDKLPSFKRLIEYAQESPKGLEIFNLESLADARNTKYNAYKGYQSRY